MADQHPGWDSVAYAACENCGEDVEHQRGTDPPRFCCDDCEGEYVSTAQADGCWDRIARNH